MIYTFIRFHPHYCAHFTPFIQRHYCTYLVSGVESETQISTISKKFTIFGVDK